MRRLLLVAVLALLLMLMLGTSVASAEPPITITVIPPGGAEFNSGFDDGSGIPPNMIVEPPNGKLIKPHSEMPAQAGIPNSNASNGAAHANGNSVHEAMNPCPFCGAEVPTGAKVCPECGEPLPSGGG